MTSPTQDWPADAKDPRKFALTCCARVELVSSTFPRGTEVRFENATHINPAGDPVEMMHLVFGIDFDPRTTHKPHEWIAILHYDGHYHLFSVESTMYGGYIHDEAGIGGWHIDPFTGATYRMVGTFSLGRRPSRFEIPLGRCLQLEAMIHHWGPGDYLVEYVGYARKTIYVPWPQGFEARRKPEEMQGVADLVARALTEPDLQE